MVHHSGVFRIFRGAFEDQGHACSFDWDKKGELSLKPLLIRRVTGVVVLTILT